uniref:Uncharacterized protein n=1 Tax=Anguilla anguilla TaxID=7936 RepID=A0A0E9U216_ANGAN
MASPDSEACWGLQLNHRGHAKRSHSRVKRSLATVDRHRNMLACGFMRDSVSCLEITVL